MNNTFYSPNDYRSYLEHHGVLGMKWGIRKADKKYKKLDSKAKKTEKGSRIVSKIPEHYSKTTETSSKRYRASKAYSDALSSKAEKRRSKANSALNLSNTKKTDYHDMLTKSTDAKLLYKNRSQLSDAELRDRVNRINMEVQLKDLSKRQRSTGARYISDSFGSTRRDLDSTARKMIIKGAIKSVGA